MRKKFITIFGFNKFLKIKNFFFLLYYKIILKNKMTHLI